MNFLRTYLAVFLVSVFSIGMVYQTTTVVHFYFNQAEITEKFCENKSQPEKKCHGKCHLNKQLNIKTSDEQKDVQVNIEGISFWLFALEILEEVRLPELFSKRQDLADNLFFRLKTYNPSSFVPPDSYRIFPG